VKLLATLTFGFLLSLGGAYLLASNLCTSVLLGSHTFDFLCGHNLYLQLIPEFLIFLAMVLFLALRSRARPKAE